MKSILTEEVKKSVFIGAFDSENFLRDENLAKLPMVNDMQANNIVLTMDELQFVFCKSEDVLISRYTMNEAHKEYLSSIGIHFKNNKKNIDNTDDKYKSVFQIMCEGENSDCDEEKKLENLHCSPFAVIPFVKEMALKYNLDFRAPSMNTIKNVNSKIFSTQLKERLEINNYGKIVTNCKDLLEDGKEYLKSSAFLIKDECGVSGKGNLLITSEAILNRIGSYLSGQENKGKNLKLVLEPFLDKELDFSCQYYIDVTGSFRLISIQRIINNNFAYQGSFTPEQEFLEFLDQKKYFSIMEDVMKELYNCGYFGHVCIDSMLLTNGELVPVVEINARKSMSLIKHYIDKHLSRFSLQGNLTYFSVSFKDNINFEQFIEKMEAEKLLFKPEYRKGIMPLTANSLFINRDIDNNRDSQKTYKGRLYLSSIAESHEEILNTVANMRSFLQNNGFILQN